MSCGAETSKQIQFQQYSKDEQITLANELDEKCPITKDKYGNEVSSCPMIDRAIRDYKQLRDKLRIR